MTIQKRDEIEFNETKYCLAVNQYPLELLFKDNRESLLNSINWFGLSKKKKIPRPNFRNGIVMTSCWRGYVGKWLIKDNMLYLKDIEGLVDISTYILEGKEPEKPKSMLHLVFPEHAGPVEAIWFTGKLKLCAGYCKLEESIELSLDFKKGVLVNPG